MSSASLGKAKRPKKENNFFFVPKDTWTHEFCLVARTDQQTTPSVKLSSSLRDAGMGKKKIVFPNKKAGHEEFRKELEKAFPKLASQNGAFELFRSGSGGSCRPLNIIPPCKDGYTIPFLKDIVSNATVIYIRPTQTDLSMQAESDCDVAASPLAECTNCHSKVPFLTMREHRKGCLADVDEEKAATAKPDMEDKNEYPLDCLFDDVMPCSSSMNDDSWFEELQSIFPNVDDSKISATVASAASKEEAANSIMDEANQAQTVVNEGTPTLKELLADFKNKNIKSQEKELVVDRESLWLCILRFYKRALYDPDELKKELVVRFDGEDGVDGGAIKREFFTLALNEIKQRLFEGQDANMLPVKDSSKGILFRIAGALCVHSVLQGCAIGLAFLAPCVYYYIAELDEDMIMSSINNDLIPRNAATEILIELLSSLENCEDNEQVQSVLDGNPKCDQFWATINASHWAKDCLITKRTKDALCNHLIFNELIESRRMEMDDIKKGLNVLNFHDVVKRFPDVLRPMFVADEEQKFDGSDLLKMMHLEKESDDFAKKQAWEWFVAFLNANEKSEEYPGGSACTAMLSFCTGLKRIPFGGLRSEISVRFHPDDDQYSLPTVSACLFILHLPIVHSSENKFLQAIKIALKHECEGFPSI